MHNDGAALGCMSSRECAKGVTQDTEEMIYQITHTHTHTHTNEANMLCHRDQYVSNGVYVSVLNKEK